MSIILTDPLHASEPAVHRPPTPSPATANWLPVVSNVLAVIAVVVLLFGGYLFGASRLLETRAQHALGQQLAASTGATSGAEAFHGQVPAEGQSVAVLSIPAIGLTDFVVEGTSSGDLEKGPGLLIGSAPPGVGGDTVIEGRRGSFGGPFGRLAQLRSGEDVQITSALGRFTYKVLGADVVGPGSVDPVAAEPAGRLTLVTSASSLLPRDSLVVQAALQGTPVATATTALPPDSTLGQSGDPAAGLWTYVAGQLLIAGAVGLWLARRRARRTNPGGSLPVMTWVLAIPVGVALLLVFFAELTKLLPATL